MRSARGSQFGTRGSKNFSFDGANVPSPREEREQYFAKQREEADKKFGKMTTTFVDVYLADQACRATKVAGIEEDVEKARAARDQMTKRAIDVLKSCPLFAGKLSADDRKREMVQALTSAVDAGRN